MPSDGKSRKLLLQDLAGLAHVDIKWDKNGCTVLFGAWEHIVEAQVVLANYLSTLKKKTPHNTEENPDPVPSENKQCIQLYPSPKTTPTALLRYYRCKYLNRQLRTHPKKRKIRYMSKTKCASLRLDEMDKPPEKEVYVNITLTQPANKCSEVVSVLDNIAIPLDLSVEKKYLHAKENCPCKVEKFSEVLQEDAVNCSKADKVDSGNDIVHPEKERISVPDPSAAKLANRKMIKKNYEELAPYKFFCPLCSFKTKRESHFQHHEELHKQASQLFFCDKCDFSTIRKGYLYRHKMTHSNIKYYCNLCHYFTDQTRLLSKHKRVKHENSKNQSSSKTLSCAECKYTTNRRHLMQRHVRTHEAVTGVGQCRFQCNQCPYRASRKEHFVRHVNNVHKNRRPFLCDNCGKAFKRADALKQHRVVHADSDPRAKCVVCDRVCRSQTQLNQHLAVHSNARPFLCEICGAAFKTRAVQRTHELTIHKNPQAFPCTQCARKFNTKFALRRHTKQHSQEDTEAQEENLNSLASESEAVANMQLDGDLPQSEAFIIPDPVYAVDIADNHPLALQLLSFVQ
ncbi:zinc finger protein 260-like isoform X2 [Bacillus rossius redtenbacheri]